MYTYDYSGVRKTIGGDEFYLSFHERTVNATAAAITLDQEDGSYRLDFVSTPLRPEPGSPTADLELHVHFSYTCVIASIPSPQKDPWNGAGTSLGKFIIALDKPPPIRAFQPPVTSIDLSQYETVISFGDSLMHDLVKFDMVMFDYPLPFPPESFFKPNLKYHDNPNSPLSLQTLPYLIGKLTEWHSKDLSTNRSTALLLGSAAWDVVEWRRGEYQDRPFDNHIQACRLLIEHVRANYPTVTIFWKLPSPVHVHLAIAPWCIRKVECRRMFRYWGQARM
jgi:hypothetical protein